ncbi:hypothetical protein [Pleionea sp. CnH1-48]|uniref:hypothetical protein n=1 Tax=Pleionea sp. CnH1-48 TaxID=2954494 RepID=UPI0020983CAE|nr:hypothetical protein [Pleionea sp. CnH1-48]MCO7227542.1 hypothetical protein [Pleionea sp. CnH1-48]
MGQLLVDFAAQYHNVTIHLIDMNRAVDVVGEGLDISLRAIIGILKTLFGG